MTAPEPRSGPPDDTEAYVGLPVAEARKRAAAHGWHTIRVIEDEETVVTAEHRAGRINLLASRGHVTRCWFG